MPPPSLAQVVRCTECGSPHVPGCDAACPVDLRRLCAGCSLGILGISRALLEDALREARRTGIDGRPWGWAGSGSSYRHRRQILSRYRRYRNGY